MLYRVLVRAMGALFVMSLLASCSAIDRGAQDLRERQSVAVTQNDFSVGHRKLALLVRQQREQAVLLRKISNQIDNIQSKVETIKTVSARSAVQKIGVSSSFSQCLKSCRNNKNDYYTCRQECTCHQECLTFENSNEQACQSFCTSD